MKYRGEKSGFTLFELCLAMAVLAVTACSLSDLMIHMQRAQALAETHLAVAHELSRQTQMARAMPLGQLLALPDASIRQNGRLDGVLMSSNLTPVVIWQRLPAEKLTPAGELAYRIDVSVAVQRLGISIAATGMVVRAMERETRLKAED
ncbi:MAG: prepilin-type N-terminal cleavage/methylation domain-containing protein [Verrucomicrobiae bacterium]|nr:prepilin-type N-terminal cleavage/methylation domain-containing protein [Verrucomicrobiae bacterium]